MSAPNELRGQEAWSLALMRAQGREAEARHYLEQINRVQRAFGGEDYSMPEPLMTGEPDYIFCPVDSTKTLAELRAEQLTETIGDPLLKRRAA